MLLENKVGVIYGAGGSIGGAVARAFARETLYGQVGESKRVASRVKAIQTQSNRVGYQVGM